MKFKLVNYFIIILPIFRTIFFTYTTIQKVIFEIFFKSLLCSPGLHLFDQKYNKNSNIVKLQNSDIAVFYFNIF